VGYIKCREGGFNFHGETPQGFGWNEGLTREYRVSPLVPVLRERRFRSGSATIPPPVGDPSPGVLEAAGDGSVQGAS
jgi:hypothetical protein